MSTQVQGPDLRRLAEEIEEYASRLSAIKPVLNHIGDTCDVKQHVFGQLELAASVADYVNFGLSEMAEKLKRTQATPSKEAV